MNKESDVLFLFAIAKEIKRSHECPVILLTQNDFANNIYNSMVSMRCALLHQSPTQTVTEIVNNFHLEWLRAVEDAENLQRRAKDTPRESVLESVDYTMECIKNRHKYFKQYINYVNKHLSLPQKALILDELKTIKDMQEIDCCALLEKQKCLSYSADKGEFTSLVLDEIEELLNWLDRLYDHLALQFCELLVLPELPIKLSKALQQIFDEIASFLSQKARKVKDGKPAKSNREKTWHSSSRAICTLTDNSINKTVEKIKKLEDRIDHQKNEKSSSGVLALQHKAIFLEDRLESLEKLKSSLIFLKKQKCINHNDEQKETNGEDEVHFFNHLLPREARCCLADKLLQLWENAINNSQTNSIISLMRNETKEIIRDYVGYFAVDKDRRKLYMKKSDSKTYQLEKMNIPVSGNDDENHVYFYDDCGRYYLTNNKERVYKAHPCASEYMLDKTGMLCKMTEAVDGVDYKYDTLVRYCIDNNKTTTNKVVVDKVDYKQDSVKKYRPDDLGNLVKIGNVEQYDLVACKPTEDSLDLKKVGETLSRCATELALPLEPIQLADKSNKYYIKDFFKIFLHTKGAVSRKILKNTALD